MLKSSLPFSLFFLLVFGTVGLAQKIHQPKLTPQNSGTTQGLIAVSPVNPRVVWARDAAARLLLLPMEEITGKPVWFRAPRLCSFAMCRA